MCMYAINLKGFHDLFEPLLFTACPTEEKLDLTKTPDKSLTLNNYWIDYDVIVGKVTSYLTLTDEVFSFSFLK